MQIVALTDRDFDAWISLRQALWPRESSPHLEEDARRTLVDPNQAGFLAFSEKGQPIGFIEAAVYRDTEKNSPRAHIEAWYVTPDRRRQGIGAALLAHVEQWCLHRTIALLTSDTNAEYPLSPAAHEGSGFRPLAELRIFVKELTS
jgi:aminoglycoside 6'-N-acetyltransferase I